jgi:diguanylate cyclase (GGDEF)-like protein
VTGARVGAAGRSSGRGPRRCLLLLCSLLAAPAWAQDAHSASDPATGLGEEIDLLGLNRADPSLPAGRVDAAISLAERDPQAAEAALDALEAEWLGGSAALPAGLRPLLEFGRAQLLVETGQVEALERHLRELASSGPVDPLDPRTGPQLLLRSQLAELQGRGSESAQLAREALQHLAAGCPARVELQDGAVFEMDAEPPPSLASHPRCDYRATWLAHRQVERQALAGGLLARARGENQARLQLVRAAGDSARSALTWSALGFIAAREGESLEQVQRYHARARELAEATGDPGLRIRVLVNAATVQAERGDARAALPMLRSALQLARDAGLTRLQPRLYTNLAEAYLRSAQPRRALSAAEQGLSLEAATPDPRARRALLSNAAQAHVALGEGERGRERLAEAEALLEQEGGDGERARMLREFGEALAAAGDAEGALAVYHRERALSGEISRANLEAALAEIRAGFDAELKLRDMAVLQDQLETRQAQLASQDLLLRIWLLLAALLAVLLLAGIGVYGRLRGRERQLHARRERLRMESEQDPLTGLGNRRAMALRMAEPDMARAEACLILIDIDHFKRINDRHGHAVGDRVLVEFSARVAACLRREDLVVRWGGEEFLIHAGGVSAEQALALARRLLDRIGAQPIETSAGELPVTASLGLCLTRLAPGQAPLGWETALRLADLALYAAKSRGRDRAVAVLGAHAVDADSLARAEADFEQAERSGLLRVQSVVPGRSL